MSNIKIKNKLLRKKRFTVIGKICVLVLVFFGMGSITIEASASGYCWTYEEIEVGVDQEIKITGTDEQDCDGINEVWFDPSAEVDNDPSATTSESVKLLNPLTGTAEGISGYVIYARLINAFLGFVGTVSLFFFVLGGFTWMISAGNPEKIKKGRDTLVWAVVGIITTMMSYSILKLVISTLKGG